MTKTIKIIIGSSLTVGLIAVGIFVAVNNMNEKNDSSDSNSSNQSSTIKEEQKIKSNTEEIDASFDEQSTVQDSEDVVSNTETPQETNTLTSEQNSETSTETEYKTYTNEFFPDFELKYPNDYSVQELYDPVGPNSPFALTLNLNKFIDDETIEQFSLVLNPRTGPISCTSPITEEYELSYTFKSGLNEYTSTLDSTSIVNYANPTCENFSIISNLDYQEYDIVSNINNNIIYDVKFFGSAINSDVPYDTFRNIVEKNNLDTKKLLVDR